MFTNDIYFKKRETSANWTGCVNLCIISRILICTLHYKRNTEFEFVRKMTMTCNSNQRAPSQDSTTMQGTKINSLWEMY